MYRGGGNIRFSANKDNFGFFSSLNYGNLSHAHPTTIEVLRLGGTLSVKDEIQYGVFEIGGLYRFNKERFSLDALAGIRYSHIKTRFATRNTVVSANKDSVVPLLGGNLEVPVTDYWKIGARVTVSGLGLGSEFTTDSEARIFYNFSENSYCYFGYRFLTIEYDQEAGNLTKPRIFNIPVSLKTYRDINIHIESVIHGPTLGVELCW